MLTQAVREALEAELKHLEIQRQRTDRKIAGIKAILLPEDEPFQAPLPLTGMEKPLPRSRTETGPLAEKGLSESIRFILSSYPTGLRTSDILERLKDGGYKGASSERFRASVNSELWRLKDKKKILKKSKRYLLPPAEQKNEAKEAAA
jgi:hypothetical protein